MYASSVYDPQTKKELLDDAGTEFQACGEEMMHGKT